MTFPAAATPASTRDDCLALDARDPLRPMRDSFALPEGVVYLDGNSLGALPRQTVARVQRVVEDEWGRGLIGSWNDAGWIDLASRIGDKIAWLVGAGPGEVMVCDSTSVNLFKVLHAAAQLVAADAPRRRVILSERGNFPTDLYIAESVAASHGMTLRLVEADEIEASLDAEVAIVLLTHVDYRSGRLLPMAALNEAAHAAGSLVVWDLAHSAGAVPLDLKGNGPIAEAADFAIGCGYKYLNGGPGAPAFLWAHPRHTARMDRDAMRQPLSGWLGHATPFAFATTYRPAAGIARFVCGTPPVLSMSALDAGLDVFLSSEAHGGLGALRHKSIALTDLFIDRVEATCGGHGLALVTPRDPAARGSHVSFAHPDGHAIVQALIARGVVGDFRAGDGTRQPPSPDLLRFGFAPLYNGFVDAWDAASALQAVLASGEWRDEAFSRRAAVT